MEEEEEGGEVRGENEEKAGMGCFLKIGSGGGRRAAVQIPNLPFFFTYFF